MSTDTTTPTPTPEQLAILWHTLGMSSKNGGGAARGAFYRNRFQSAPGHADQPVIDQLVQRGWMQAFTPSTPESYPECRYWYSATMLGQCVAVENIPRKPRRLPLTKKVSRGLTIMRSLCAGSQDPYVPADFDAAVRWIKRLDECNTYRPPLGW